MYIYRYSDDEYNRCLEFSKKLSEKTLSSYTTRNQGNLDKIVTDQVIGKLAEIANYHYIKTVDTSVSYPDLTIYDDRSRVSYDADLSSNRFTYHCKSQQFEQAKRYGLSWTFGKRDPVIVNATSRDIAVFSAVNMQQKEVAICGVIPLIRIVERKLFVPPALAKLKYEKVVIYYQHLKPYLKEEFKQKQYIN